ncbi:MAG TPA: amidohydrolase [Gammaproteobacteria bacterium]|nr:amidohydrolase [Gammaproteobacteria bacterium]
MFKIKKVMQQAAILLALLCMSDLIAGNSKAYINGSIHTFDQELTVVDSILVKDGIIQYIGNTDDVISHANEEIEVIDLAGKMMMPSFHDAHAHPVWSGVEAFKCVLLDINDIEMIKKKLKACLESDLTKATGWLYAGGFNIGLFPSANPHKSFLDSISEEVPIFLSASDGHNALVNSRALELAKITSLTPNPEGAIIEKDPITGEPSGTLREPAASSLVSNLIPPDSDELQEKGLIYAQNLAHQYGITSMVAASEGAKELTSFKRVADRGDLNLRLIACIDLGVTNFAHSRDEFESIFNNRGIYRHERMRVDCIKIFIDGVLEGQTGAVLDPYIGTNNTGILYLSQEELNATVSEFDSQGIQVMTHAIGDKAVRSILDAYEYAIENNGERDNRHHISHLQLIHKKDIPRFGALNVIANFQAAWALPDEWITLVNLPEVGLDRVNRMYPIRSVHDAGGMVAGGSDWAVSTMNPLVAIETAIRRSDPDDEIDGTLNEDEKMDLTEMLKAYTINGAYLMHQDHLTGSIETGKYADLIILEENLYEIPHEKISEVKVIQTLLEGETVFRIN